MLVQFLRVLLGKRLNFKVISLEPFANVDYLDPDPVL